jgi:predicted DNA-binding ribbon-helix-helix protein
MTSRTCSYSHPIYEPVVKRGVFISGRHTSISLEGGFWQAIGDIALDEGMSSNALISEINEKKGQLSLSSSIRQFVLFHLKGHAQLVISNRASRWFGKERRVRVRRD